MSKASATAQQFVKDNQDGLDDINRLSFLYAHETRKSQFGKSLEDSFTGAVNAIRLYNEGTKKAGLTTDEFHEVVAKVNPELDAYITKMEADGKKPTEWGYIWATKQAAIETALFTSAIAAGQLALNAVAKNADPQAAKIVGALTSVAGGITAVVSAIAMAKGALSLTAGGLPHSLRGSGLSIRRRKGCARRGKRISTKSRTSSRALRSWRMRMSTSVSI